jgi:Domain of unknown function (DUF4864)
MFRRLVIVVLLVLAALPAWAQDLARDVSADERGRIRAVIEGQIEAMRRDDAAGAFAFASPSIQAIFRTAENFLTMVRTGYAAVYRPRSVAFTDLLRFDEVLVQLVDVVGPDGRPVIAAYVMEIQPDGSWRINGCELLPPANRII